jgi:hypothetical protein
MYKRLSFKRDSKLSLSQIGENFQLLDYLFEYKGKNFELEIEFYIEFEEGHVNDVNFLLC